jgi:hypothetical protein
MTQLIVHGKQRTVAAFKVLPPLYALCLGVLAMLALALGAVTSASAAPTAPTLLSPADNADVRIPFTISWSAASDPSGILAYNWQISASSSFSSVLKQDSTMGETQDTVSGLATGTYYWRVQAVSNDFVQGPWSSPRRFKITGAGAGLPATPTLNLPRGGTHFHPWESFGMSWSAVSGAAKYVLEASKDGTFPASGTVFRWESETPSTTILITTADMGDYKARVFAVDANGIMSMPSNVIGFKISFDAPIAAAPTIVAPTGGAETSLPITFTWNHVINPQPSGYQLQISSSSNFSAIEADIPQLNGPSYTVINLPTTGTKYWRVRSFQGVLDASGTAAATAWSSTGTFVVPDAPLRVSTITLSRPTPASGQEVYVDLQLNRAVPSSGGTVTLSSSNPSAAPLPASVAVQGSTSWVQFRFWTGQVETPTSVTMTATIGAESTSHTFTVYPASLKSLDGVPLRTSGGTTLSPIVALNGQAPAGGAVVSLSSSHPAASPPATVTVPAGVESTWVAIPTSAVTQDTPVTITATWKDVTVQAQTTLTPQPAPTSLTLDPSTTSSSSGSTGRVTIAAPSADDVSFALSSSHPDLARVPGSVLIPAGVTASSFIISTVGVTQRTEVIISVTGGGVTLTATLTLEPVAAPTPTPVTLTAPSLLSPAADARFAPGTTINFDWSDVSGAATYTIQVSTSSTFSTTVLNQTVTPSQYSTSTLPTADLYWRVRANDASGKAGPWSSTRQFRIKS